MSLRIEIPRRHITLAVLGLRSAAQEMPGNPHMRRAAEYLQRAQEELAQVQPEAPRDSAPG